MCHLAEIDAANAVAESAVVEVDAAAVARAGRGVRYIGREVFPRFAERLHVAVTGGNCRRCTSSASSGR